MFKNAEEIDKLVNSGLMSGTAVETSGGILIVLENEEVAAEFCAEIKAIDNQPAFIIGKVVKGDAKVILE